MSQTKALEVFGKEKLRMHVDHLTGFNSRSSFSMSRVDDGGFVG